MKINKIVSFRKAEDRGTKSHITSYGIFPITPQLVLVDPECFRKTLGDCKEYYINDIYDINNHSIGTCFTYKIEMDPGYYEYKRLYIFSAGIYTEKQELTIDDVIKYKGMILRIISYNEDGDGNVSISLKENPIDSMGSGRNEAWKQIFVDVKKQSWM